MDDMELIATIQGLLVRVKVVTGWSIPDLESERRILYSEFAIHLQEKWATLNHEEIMFAVRNYAGTDWGKNVNLKLLDDAIEVYHRKRVVLSQIEEQKKGKQPELANVNADWKSLCEESYQSYLKGKLNIDLMPHQLYDEFVGSKFIEDGVMNDFIEDAKKKLIASATGKKEMAQLGRKMKEVAEWQRQIDGYNQYNETVMFYAKRLSVLFLFWAAKKDNIQNFYVKE